MNEPPAGRPVGRLARWLLPSLESYSALVVLVLLVKSSWRFLADSDTGWHIRTGQWILQNHAVPRHDLFSYTMAGRDWFAWEWLSDVLLSVAHRAAGLAGVVAAAMLVLFVCFALLYRLMRQRGADPLVALIVTSLGAVVSMVHWLARPHLLSILFMILWYAMVESYRRDRSRWIYLVPLLVAVWANTHGAFVVTIPILLVYAAGEFVEHGLNHRMRESRKPVTTYVVVAVLSLIAALATPYGYKLYGHLWQYLTDSSLLAAINEFQSPDFHKLDGKMIEVLLALGGVAAARSLLRGRVIDLLLLVLLGHMTLQSERHVTIATVMLIPIIAEQWTGLIGQVSAYISRDEGWCGGRWRPIRDWYLGFRAVDQQLRGVLIYPIAVAFLLLAARGVWGKDLLKPRFDPATFPVGAADFVSSARPEGNMYAVDQFGGYLIYRFFPELKVFADGRSDLYRHGTVLDDMSSLSTLKPTWSEVLDRHDIKWMVLRHDEPLVSVTEISGKWNTVYEDKTARVVVRK